MPQQATIALEKMIDAAACGIFITDEKGVIVYSNAYFMQILGYSTDELCGKQLRQVVQESDLGNTDAMIKRASCSPESHSDTILFKSKDGIAMPLLLDVCLLESDSDGSHRIVVNATDIRHSILLKNELKLSEKKYRTMFEEAPVSFFEVDISLVWDALHQPEFKVLSSNPVQQDKLASMVRLMNVNQEAVKLFQADSKEALLSRQDEILIDYNTFLPKAIVHSMTEGGGSFEVEGRHQTLKDELKYVASKWNMPRAIEYEPKTILVSLKDITARKQLEADKEILSTQVNRSHRLETIGTLAGGIAHDFNNILTPILGYVEMALEDLGPEHALNDDLTRVSKAASRAKELVNHILVFGRQVESDPASVESAMVVQEVVQFVRHSIPSTIKIKELIRDEQVTVLVDPTQLHQVLLNLCTNAFLAMQDQKQGLLEIEQRCIQADSHFLDHHPGLKPGRYVRLSVKDTGSGITPHDIEHVFEPFFTTRDVGEGTGLGLSVVHGIIKAHNGAITVYSEVGRGTVFHVYLPLSSMPQAKTEISEDRVPSGTERVLIIDDELPVVDATSTMLRRLGYAVKGFSSSTDALKEFEESPEAFDVVITDMTMPEQDGAKVAQQIKGIRSDMPVILITGFAHAEREHLLSQGIIEAIVNKPILRRDIAETIREVLDTQKAEITL